MEPGDNKIDAGLERVPTDTPGLENGSLLDWFGAIAGVAWLVDADSHRVVRLSPSFETIWGRPAQQCIDDPSLWWASVHPEDREHCRQALAKGGARGEYDVEYRVLQRDGSTRVVRDRSFGTVAPNQFGVDRPIIAGVATDITLQRSPTDVPRPNVFRAACEGSCIPMVLVDTNGQLKWSNEAAWRSLSSTSTRLPASFTSLILDDAERATFSSVLASAAASRDASAAHISLSLGAEQGDARRVDCVISHVPPEPDHPHARCVVQWVDGVSVGTREAELIAQTAELTTAADHDPLTRLLNRRGLERRLQHEMAVSQRSGEPAVVLLVDVDLFKRVNDTHSHTAGDQVLVSLANRLRDVLRPRDTLARIGGDEFAVFLPGTRLSEGAHVAEKLRRAVGARPLDDVDVTVSIGVTAAPHQAASVTDLVDGASDALKKAKRKGRNGVALPDSLGEAARLACDGTNFANILSGERLHVVRQTINHVDDGAHIGTEHLIRGPAEIPMPEELFGLARSLRRSEEFDLACLRACLESVKADESAPLAHVNLLPTTLHVNEGRDVFDLLAAAAPATPLCIELSERHFVGASANLRRAASTLREMGFRVALDNLGFGRSSLESILAIEPDIVKIDRTQVAGISDDAGRRRSLMRLIDLLTTSDSKVIATGVEIAEERDVLAEMGVEFAQGYFWSTPSR